MEQIEVAIILLTILITVISAVLIALLVLVVIVLTKLNKLTNEARSITENISSATAWLSPTTVFSAAVRAFRSNK
ncbi:MAG: hypothetical protein UY35_C0003G0028 [Candidatus Saccharibacteria bacterium GW2011_GWC2_48_9]|nr:MAG: hypothetical protein UY35_C0003G0028 [Candidatus Saccharibacteria bacterium GW2011_GWC2_48_9]